MSSIARNDPLTETHYRNLNRIKNAIGTLFLTSAALSILLFLMDETKNPERYLFAQLAFVLLTVAGFILNLAMRISLAPSAHAARVTDFVANVFRTSLAPQASVGYFSSAESVEEKRLTANLMENCFFTARILKKMLVTERMKASVYFCLLIAAIFYRKTDPALVAVIAQVVLSEHILSQWARMEWLKRTVDSLYAELRTAVQISKGHRSDDMRAATLNAAFKYEIFKAQAGISLSTKTFNALNQKLSREWETEMDSLGITRKKS